MTKTLITWKRKGTCRREICGGICCKVLENGEYENNIIVKNNKCIHLTEENLCSRQNTDKPEACKEFPASPWDTTYLKVKDKCTYYFEITETEE